jgi:hypothetical protein
MWLELWSWLTLSSALLKAWETLVGQWSLELLSCCPWLSLQATCKEQLIRSVHLFSSRPVVVVHFGMATPSEWDPSQYPRFSGRSWEFFHILWTLKG